LGEQNIEEEDAPLSNKEKILLKKAVLWSRIRYGLVQQQPKMAQYSELSHFILIAKTDIKSSTNWATFSIAFSGFATGNGTC
jgi:hypothetical protein